MWYATKVKTQFQKRKEMTQPVTPQKPYAIAQGITHMAQILRVTYILIAILPLCCDYPLEL